MSNFGASFRKARESSGLPLETIAADTRISSRFLVAIENEDFHLLPGGVFNRGFIRSYAERVGLDPDQALADYDRLSSNVEEPVEILRNAERASLRRSEKNLYPIAALVLLILIAVFYIFTRNSSTGTGTASQPAPAVPAEPAPVAAPPAAETIVPAEEEAAPEADSPPEPEANLPSALPSAPTIPQLATAPPQNAESALVLDVDVRDLTWMQITTDGNVALNDNLQVGVTRRFTAESSIKVSIGNAAGVSLKINGREVPSLGESGQVRAFTITPENAARIR